MRQRFGFVFGSALLLVVLFTISSSATVSSAHSKSAGVNLVHLQATPPSELPADTKVLELDKPITDTLDPQTPGRLYKFDAKADQILRLSIESKSNDLYAMVTVLDMDLQTVLAGTQGQTILGGSVILRIPQEGTYVVSVDYSDQMIGTPNPGSYDLTLSEYKSK